MLSWAEIIVSVAVREGCEGFTIIGFNGPKKCQSRKPKSAHFHPKNRGLSLMKIKIKNFFCGGWVITFNMYV